MLKKGLTLVELLVVVGVLSILFAITSMNLVTPQRRTTLQETLSVLSSDMRSQQLKAMLGDSGGTTPENYGIYFSSDSYTLFKGNVYDPANTTNFEVELSTGFNFTGIDFPSSTIIFARGSGEVSNFLADEYEINLTDTQDGHNTVIVLNKYGTISQTY